MRTRLRTDSARLGAGVRRLLAQGRPVRVAACAAVALAAVVWLGVAIAVLRVVLVVGLVLAALWCAWLVYAVWREPDDWEGPSVPAWRLVWARMQSVLPAGPPPAPQSVREPAEPERPALVEWEPRRPAEALTAELVDRLERRHANAERLLHELAGQIETMRALVARIAEVEQDVSRLAADREPPARDRGAAPADDPLADPDLQAAFQELEADLRLEKIEEREQLLGERERRLERRERELAAFVAETQSRL